jgi:predicted DNA-binding helix-hairpin-helix protein
LISTVILRFRRRGGLSYIFEAPGLHLDIEYKINKDLDNIRKWIISNKLTLNIGKTEYMIIGSKPRLDAIPETSKIIYGDYQLKRIKKKKFLAL